jgi:Short C-terminal domain
MMLGGVGFQVGLDEARRKQLARVTQAPDVVEQLKELKALHDDGFLSPEEFGMAKRKLLDG